ncbi:MAG: 3-hydroxyacyl-ACP dehydratase [Verrucomicrobiota bacterium]
MAENCILERSEILETIPQGEPFVFLDQAAIAEKSATGRYRIRGSEVFMPGHFPGRPVFPASIMVEALGQLAIAYIMYCYAEDGVQADSIYFLKSEDVHCQRKCLPGDGLEMTVRLLRVREPLIVFAGEISVDGEQALKVTSFTLSFATAP